MAEASSDVVERLEGLVGKASAEIAELRKSKQALEAEVAQLKESLDSLESDRAEEQGERVAWTEQRQAIETKLEGLVQGLEELL